MRGRWARRIFLPLKTLQLIRQCSSQHRLKRLLSDGDRIHYGLARQICNSQTFSLLWATPAHRAHVHSLSVLC